MVLALLSAPEPIPYFINMKVTFKLLVLLLAVSFAVSCDRHREANGNGVRNDSVVDLSTSGPATFLEGVTQHIYYGEFEKNLQYYILSKRYKEVYNNPDSIEAFNKRYSEIRKEFGGFKVVRVLDMIEDGDFLYMKSETVLGDTVLPCQDFKLTCVDGKWRIILE